MSPLRFGFLKMDPAIVLTLVIFQHHKESSGDSSSSFVGSPKKTQEGITFVCAGSTHVETAASIIGKSKV